MTAGQNDNGPTLLCCELEAAAQEKGFFYFHSGATRKHQHTVTAHGGEKEERAPKGERERKKKKKRLTGFYGEGGEGHAGL